MTSTVGDQSSYDDTRPILFVSYCLQSHDLHVNYLHIRYFGFLLFFSSLSHVNYKHLLLYIINAPFLKILSKSDAACFSYINAQNGFDLLM